MFCYKCGKKIEDDSVFCNSCGAKIKNESNKEDNNARIETNIKVRKFAILDEVISFSENEIERIGVETPFRVFAFRAQEALGEFLNHKVKNFDDLYNYGFQYYMTAVYRKTVTLALRVLKENGVDYIDAATLTNRFVDYFDIEESLSAFVKCKNLIEEWIEKVKIAREYERETRARWSGGGFGIKGAIKGAVNAAVLNFGTDMIHSISDSRVDTKDKKELAKMKKELYEKCDIKENMKESLFDAICAYGTMIYEILVEEGIYTLHEWYPNKAKGKYINLVERSKKVEIESQDIIKSLCECIRLWPYISTVIESLFNMAEDETDCLCVYELAEYLGFSEML